MKWKIGLENKANTYFGGFICKSPALKQKKRNEKLLTKARQIESFNCKFH